jgi:hypothetical protein
MDPITHLTAAAVYVASLVALALLAVRVVNDLLDELSYRRAVRRRLYRMARPR